MKAFPTLCAGTSENIIVTKRPFICLFSSAGCNRPCIFHSRKFKVETQTPPLLLRSASKGGGGMQSYSPALLLKVHFKQKGCPSHHQIPNKSLLTIFTFLKASMIFGPFLGTVYVYPTKNSYLWCLI